MTDTTPDPPPEPDRPAPSSGADPEKAPEEPAPAAAEPAAPPPGTAEPAPTAAAPEPGPATVEPEPAPATEPAAATAAQHEPEPAPTSPEPVPRAAEPGATAAAGAAAAGAREPEHAATAVERPDGAAHGARRTRTGPLRVLAILVILGGVILSAAGVITWIVVTDQLSDEKIVVSDDADNFAGEDVDGPFTAYAEAEVIQDHALEASDGLTYAELDQDDPRRETVMTASFLRASLFTSVVAFGVAAFAVGLGILLIIVGWALLRINRSLRVTT